MASVPHLPRPSPLPLPRLPVIVDAPLLANGDHLTQSEFHWRYERMPELKKAELIEGVVYMSSPVGCDFHAGHDLELHVWLGTYMAATLGVKAYANGTWILNEKNECQPDCFLCWEPEYGGRSRLEGKYREGAPELVAEVAASSQSIDLHTKKHVYQQQGVLEYLVWRVLERGLDWFFLRDGKYVPKLPDRNGVIKSEAFPGLWLDVPALLAQNLAAVLACLQRGLNSREHKALLRKLKNQQK
jgi:Uma2 family endonuclease